jgi:hypothetical protein
MAPSLLVYPMFAMVLLTAAVLVTLFRSRVRAVREGLVPGVFYKTYQGAAEPEYAVKPARHFTNLFEAPTLFYAVCLAAMVTDHANVLFHGLAWLYVGVRAVHAWVHLGPNKLRQRIAVYGTSWVVLVLLWLDLAVVVALS